MSDTHRDIVLEVVQRTLAEERARAQQDKIDTRKRVEEGGPEAEEADEEVEEGARRAALLGVAMGKRMELPDTFRVSEHNQGQS